MSATFRQPPPLKTFSATITDQHEHTIQLTGIAGSSKLSALHAISALDALSTQSLTEADVWTITLTSP